MVLPTGVSEEEFILSFLISIVFGFILSVLIIIAILKYFGDDDV